MWGAWSRAESGFGQEVEVRLAGLVIEVEPVDGTKTKELVEAGNRFFLLDLRQSSRRDIEIVIGLLRCNHQTRVLDLAHPDLQPFANGLKVLSWRDFRLRRNRLGQRSLRAVGLTVNSRGAVQFTEHGRRV